eukprot:755369_1
MTQPKDFNTWFSRHNTQDINNETKETQLITLEEVNTQQFNIQQINTWSSRPNTQQFNTWLSRSNNHYGELIDQDPTLNNSTRGRQGPLTNLYSNYPLCHNHLHPNLASYQRAPTGLLPLAHHPEPNWVEIPAGQYVKTLCGYGLTPLEVLRHLQYLKWHFWNVAITAELIGQYPEVALDYTIMRQGVLKFAIIHFNYYPHDLLQIIIDEFVVHGLNTLWNETMIYKRWEVGKVVRKFKRYITTKLHSLMDWDGNAVRILYNEKAYYKGIMQQIVFDNSCVLQETLLNVISEYLYELYA